MTTPAENLARLQIQLPAVVPPVAAYVPAALTPAGAPSAVQTSGQLPLRDGQPVALGKVGADVTLEQAQDCAAAAALNAVAAAAAVAGGIERLCGVEKVTVFVSSDPDFTDQALVANGASNLLGEIFADTHTRSAVGVAVLPLNVPVELEVLFRLAD